MRTSMTFPLPSGPKNYFTKPTTHCITLITPLTMSSNENWSFLYNPLD